MAQIACEYLIPDGIGLEDVKHLIRDRVRFIEDPTDEVTRRFLDSFDWRLYLDQATLEERLDAAGRRLVWRDLGADAPPRMQGIDAAPGFAWDLPTGPVRDRLEPVLGIRRLLPLLEVRSRVQSLRLLNEDDKTVVRLLLEDNRFRDADRDREGSLAARVCLLPVRGYAADLRETARMLSRDLELEPARNQVLSEALAAAGRCPGDYSSKLDYHLDGDQRADAAAKEILRGLLDTLEANIEGAKANLDSEFLHDLRVATRRTRSALTQIKGVFASELVEDYKTRFAWVQQITGPMRDLDVYLLDFDGYQARLPPSLRPCLEPLRAFLADHYDGVHKALVQALGSTEFKGLLTSWRAFLEAPVPERSAVRNAMRPTKAVADARIRSMYRRVRKAGRAITPDSPAPELHALRKHCKKLRYLLEFFSSLYPQQIGALVKMLKRLLDNLGRFQDTAVQVDHLRETAQQMQDAGGVETDTLLAMGALIGRLFDHQQQARVAFSAIFADFDSKPNRLVWRELFAPEGRRGQRA
ncbi:CHAD domain-containing protein [Candidatus Thiosymbion oneisti]|uniref:CHAD domain-containing protein n=1 Tax=Candidatus Thiosymbion oneisti TaxID=589554 RepID=UPI000AE01441|nr:CHAD domain-containing protein [Candidatus Thiosymbion oneisti]